MQGRLRKTLSSLILHDVHQLAKTIKGKIWDMSSTELTPEANPETDAIIKQNGLTDLAGEVRLLGSRISKVVAYNAHVFKDLYATLL